MKMFILVIISMIMGQQSLALTCSSIISQQSLSIANYRIIGHNLIIDQQDFYNLTIDDLKLISQMELSLSVSKGDKFALGMAQGSRIRFSPHLSKELTYAIEVMERLSRSSIPKSFRIGGESLSTFNSLSTPHPMEPWHNYNPQFEVGMWLIKFKNGDIDAQLFSSGKRESFEEREALQAWNSLLDRVDPSEIVSVDQYHTHPYKAENANERIGHFSVVSSGGDQKVASHFLQAPPREDELGPRVGFNFYAVSRVYQSMVISQTSSRGLRTDLPEELQVD